MLKDEELSDFLHALGNQLTALSLQLDLLSEYGAGEESAPVMANVLKIKQQLIDLHKQARDSFSKA